MYYEEKCERGIWFWRNSPNGEWQEFSKDKLHAALTKARECVAKLKQGGK